MASKRPGSIGEYIEAAPPEGRALLRQLYALLKAAAPDATETLKWGNPFFVEPRFLFAFSAHKAHLSFAPMAATLEHFREDLKTHLTTSNFLKIPYDQPLPEDLIREMPAYRVRVVGERQDDGFW